MTISKYQNFNSQFKIEDAALEVGEVLQSYPSEYIHIKELFLDILPKYNLTKIDKKYNVDKVTVNKLVNELIRLNIIIPKSYDKNGVPDIVKLEKTNKCLHETGLSNHSIVCSEEIDKKSHHSIKSESCKSQISNKVNHKQKGHDNIILREHKYYIIDDGDHHTSRHSQPIPFYGKRALYLDDKIKPIGYVDSISSNHRRICILNKKYKSCYIKNHPTDKETFIGAIIDILMRNGEMSIYELKEYFKAHYHIKLDLNYINRLFKSGYNDIAYALYSIISNITVRKEKETCEMYLRYSPKYMREYILI
uniref:Transcriptional regulator n=1 Tax=Parastrongyloides trichosuri TaxID=131310 RepID=A0A0N4ZX49_PARTI